MSALPPACLCISWLEHHVCWRTSSDVAWLSSLIALAFLTCMNSLSYLGDDLAFCLVVGLPIPYCFSLDFLRAMAWLPYWSPWLFVPWVTLLGSQLYCLGTKYLNNVPPGFPHMLGRFPFMCCFPRLQKYIYIYIYMKTYRDIYRCIYI